MEEFEYSVEISDCDWECFVAECEGCNLLPPSLAGMDDSGMSDIDDKSKIAQKVAITVGFTEVDHPINGPPECQGSTMDHNLSRSSGTGMESVLSGSEEDIHLQSVNIFFERLKDASEAEKPTEPNEVRVGTERETKWEGEPFSDGHQDNSTTLAENIADLKFLDANSETAVDVTTDPVGNNSNIMKTIKNEKHFPSIFAQPIDSGSVLPTQESDDFETKLIITETRTNEAKQWSQSHESLNMGDLISGTNTKMEVFARTDDLEQDKFLKSELNFNKRTASWCNQETLANVQSKKDMNVLQSHSTSIKKIANQESSPSASVKRKRTKKRVHSVHLSDSEEEQITWRGATGLWVAEDIPLLHLKEPQKHFNSPLPVYSGANNLPVKISAKEKLYSESSVREPRLKVTQLIENSAIYDKSVTTFSQTTTSALNNSGNVASLLQPCSQLQVERSSGLNEHPVCPLTGSENGNLDLSTVTADCHRGDAHVGSLQQSNKMIHIFCCENEQQCTAEVTPRALSISPSTESNDLSLEIIQNDKRSLLAEGAGNSAEYRPTQCQREAGPQQLEIGCHYTDQYRSRLEKTPLTLSAVSMSSSDVHNPKPAGASPLFQMTPKVACNHKYCTSSSPASLNVLSEKNTAAEKTELPAPIPSDHNLIGKNLIESSICENLRSPSIITPFSSFCTLDTESVMSLSSSCVSVSQNDSRCSGGKISQTKEEEGDGLQSPCVTNEATDSKCILVLEPEDYLTASKAGRAPEMAQDSKPTVFAMSSFWSEMEKLTINDILGLRKISKAAPQGPLPLLQEGEQTDVFALTDSGIFTDESKPEHINDIPSRGLNAVESSSDSVPSTGVTWECEPIPVNLSADVYADNMMFTSIKDPGAAQTGHKKICKNISMQNLHTLESVSCSWKGQPLQILENGERDKEECFTDRRASYKAVDCLASSSTDGNSDSLTYRGVFHYLFGKEQSPLSQGATDKITYPYREGNSLPETYDHFFSDFNMGNFFYPLITGEDQTKDELDPVSTCSRPMNRTLQFPEAYEHFFVSSSSDESAVESDEEERLMTCMSRNSSASEFSVDIYDSFFTESDLEQNFSWKNAFSIGNLRFTGSTVKQQTSSSLLPMSQRGRFLQITDRPVNSLGSQDVCFSDHPLYPVEDRFSKELRHLPFEDLQVAVPNPSESSHTAIHHR